MIHFPVVVLFPIVLLFCIIFAYLLGSIPSGLLLGRAFGAGDIRKIGSGNIGATNMLRTGRHKLAAATLFFDMAKGFLAVGLSTLLFRIFIHGSFMNNTNIQVDLGHIACFFGFCAVAGHVWPVWLKFKGGKGVATTMGVFLAAAPVTGFITVLCWLATFYMTRYSSLAALVAVSVAPVIGYFTEGLNFAVAALVLAAIVFYTHQENIKRLRLGTETKWSAAGELT